jgi:hypothetical protein
MSGPSRPKQAELGLAFRLVWLRDERDPQTGRDLGVRRRRIQPACRCADEDRTLARLRGLRSRGLTVGPAPRRTDLADFLNCTT